MSDIVFEVLDGFVSMVDVKFSVLVILGEEVFIVLFVGLIVYVGKVDEILGVIEIINGVIVLFGEYLIGVGEGVKIMVVVIKVVGVVLVVMVGSCGLGVFIFFFKVVGVVCKENVVVV